MDKNNQKKQEKLKLKDLPPQLREKYKNHPIFQEQKNKRPVHQFYGTKTNQQDKQQEIKRIKEKKEKPIEERLAQIQIQSTVETSLRKVFDKLVNKSVTPKKSSGKHQDGQQQNPQSFGVEEIGRMLSKMGMKNLTRSEIQLMIWDFDENLDDRIDINEFFNMYKKCTMDENDLEPKSLFHMVQFLMYIYSDTGISDKNKDDEQKDIEDFSITQEDMLELLYVKLADKDLMDEEIGYLFGQKDEQLAEKRLTFPEYLELINKRAIEQRKRRIEEKKNERKKASNLNSQSQM